MARIALLQDGLEYIGSDLHTRYIRGIENCTIRLARGFARAGHEVWAITDDPREETCDGVTWRNWSNIGDLGKLDLAISNNSAVPFNRVDTDKKVIWVHNPTNAHRLIKKKVFGALLKHRPPAVMGSDDVRKKIPFTVPYKSRSVIQHGVGDVFLAHREKRPPPPPVAVFLAMTYRGLKPVLEGWRDVIAPAAPDARLVVIAQHDDIHCDFGRTLPGVEIKDRFPDPEDLAKFIASARVHLFPGHRDETFCNVAAESSACGLPLITSGYGALKERVIHDVSGYLEEEPTAFANRALSVLTDDALWSRLHDGALSHPDLVSWDDRAKQWAEQFLD